ncbi:kinase-like protein [Thelephora ganbajun]|uniref:Kinase-like protein n=1 Tax=Thelephora ganbajun TaxID=370292 RepID=A0ACB6Z1D5_THEGA|nr:kinase-like protein [Thelephora ganbajun]
MSNFSYSNSNLSHRRIGNWLLLEKLGSGFSGAIYRAVNVHTKPQQVVALKLQRTDESCPTNRYERFFYPILQGGFGMPTLWGSGVDGSWDYLALDLLGSSLHSLFWKSNKSTMDLGSVLCIGMQVLARLEFMHGRGILHRDIQLGNCVVGLPPNEQTIYMIDFGFSKQYIDPKTNRHIPDSKVKRDFIGNYWFSSVNVHCRGKVPSRRDDLEALALMLIHLLTPGGLSWTRKGVPKDNIEHDRLKRTKLAARPEDICRGMPDEFEEFLRYCRKLKFAETPDYGHWIDEFRGVAKSHGFPESDAFVWPPPPPPPKSHAVVPSPRKEPANTGAEIAKVLDDLGQLRLEETPKVLGDRIRIANAVQQAREAVNKPTSDDKEVIVISSEDEDDSTKPIPKARRIYLLRTKVSAATDNATLSKLLLEFVEVLEKTYSKSLTVEGFAFLDTLYKQLADPSVFVQPMRTSKRSGGSANDAAETDALAKGRARRGRLAMLKEDVEKAQTNRVLAGLVKAFGTEIDSSKGKTLPKTAFEFLHALGARLQEIK